MRTLLALFLCIACAFSSQLRAQDKTVVLYTSLAPTESGPLAQAFEKKTGIKVELWRALSEKVVQRALTEAQARRYAVDVIESGGRHRVPVTTGLFSDSLVQVTGAGLQEGQSVEVPSS